MPCQTVPASWVTKTSKSIPAAVSVGAVAPGQSELRDIAIGKQAARQLGAEDIGQGVIVRDAIVAERETMAGTDAMIERFAGQFDMQPGSVPGGVLVKMKKPDQDSRIDLPAIGAATVENAARAGLAGIAVEAGGALVLDLEATVQKADQAGLFVIGVNASDKPG